VADYSGWADLISRPETEIPLDQGALLIAAVGDRSFEVANGLAELDRLADQVDGDGCASVCRLVFETLGMRGDHQTYDDPDNSYLHRVISRRMGIPITLSVLLIEIGRRCGVPLEGVGMPGHFLVRDPSDPDLLIDAFSGGQRLDRAGCARLMQSVLGPGLEFHEAMLRPTGPRAILARMLANLDAGFRRRLDLEGCRWVTRLRIAIPDIPFRDRVALANGLATMGYYEDAAAMLEMLATESGTSIEAADALRSRARHLISRFN
jgi:regulator of sirC expression with transglutaminase-like and TPR domain